MLTILWAFIKRYGKALVIVLAFVAGASVTHLYESKRFTEYKNAELQAVINKYEEEIKHVEEISRGLHNDLLRSRDLADARLREFEAYKQRNPESQARQCDRILSLAIRGEGLLNRADDYLRALMK